jgi:hypothetical protein
MSTRVEDGTVRRVSTNGRIPAAALSAGYGVSMRVAYVSLTVLAANRYVNRPGGRKSYFVIWDPTTAARGRAAENVSPRQMWLGILRSAITRHLRPALQNATALGASPALLHVARRRLSYGGRQDTVRMSLPVVRL